MASDKTISTPSDAFGEGIQKVRAIHGRTSGPTRRSSKGQWTAEEDDILQRAVERFKGKNWKKIAECFKDRTDVQCLHRWQKVLNPELVKGPWSKEEDETIIELVKKFGPKKWSTIAQHLQGRIGKQCRERWHNHLNPSINKEAWTQEEELALIRAHQIYGNKWAELTKYLPGRTDNSIKNHWNSSVKKKLDSYLKSGLLTNIQEQQNQPVNSSSRIQNSGEVEEISECSQDSAAADRFQSSSEMTVLALQGEEPLKMEVPLPMELDSCPATCSESHYPVLDISHDNIGFVDTFLQQNSASHAETSMNDDYHFDLHDIPNISSIELGHKPLEVRSHCNEFVGDRNAHLQPSAELATSTVHVSSDKSGNTLISDDECCKILFFEAMKDDCFSGRKLDTGGDSGTSVLQSTEVDGAAPSSSQSFFTKLISADDDLLILDGDPGNLYGAQEQEYPTCSQDGFIYTNDSANSPCDNTTDVADPAKLVPVNSFNSRLDTQNCPTDAGPNIDTEGSLCYEPPRFPSSDVPFFSCDLIQSGVEMQQEYSPLGIRQLMMSSTHCITPFRLWNSPSCSSSSPEAVLKSAAKTFTGTPSILKKRNRELMSPLSDRRNQKKIETSITSRLAKDFSRLDVFVDAESGAQKAPSTTTDSIENQNPDKTHLDSTSEEIDEQETVKPIDDQVMIEVDLTSKKPSGVLIEHNVNSLPLFSPKKLDFRTLNSSSRTPRSQLHKSSCGKRSLHSSSPMSRKTSEVYPVVEKHGSSLAVTENIASKTGDDTTSENFSIFGNTPYKRSIESPSAWKSPWFINSFLAGPRVDTDITIEDIGYFMSPGDRSLDAIGLMKQVSEQTAPAYANAQEVLGNETPRTLIEERRNRGSQEQGTTSLSNPRTYRSSLHPNMTERRVLDFSGCGTPGKSGTENEKSSAAKGFSSPSSHLLKNCR